MTSPKYRFSRQSVTALVAVVAQISMLLPSGVYIGGERESAADPNPAVFASGNPFGFPNLNASAVAMPMAGAAGMFSSCFSGDLGQATQLAQAITSLTTTKSKTTDGKSCDPKSCSVEFANSLPACPSDKDAKNIDLIFKNAKDKDSQALCCLTAKESQLDEASKELGCISEQNALLANQIKSAQSTMQQNLQNSQKVLGQVDAAISDFQNQNQFILSKLNGGGKDGNGNVGLLALQQQLRGVVSQQLPAAVKSQQDLISQFNQQQQIFAQRVQDQKMGMTNRCFNMLDSRYQCFVNSASSCSFRDLILAKYYELQSSVNGSVQFNNASQKASALRKKSALDALLGQIFSDMSMDPNLAPVTQQDAQNAAANAGTIYHIRTPQDLETYYGAQLASFNVSGFDVKALFENKFEQCYQDATSKSNIAMSDPSSQYSMSVSIMNQRKKDIADSFKVFYRTYGDMYTQFWNTMGQKAPLNMSGCEGANVALAGMMKCATDLQTNLEGIYSGNTANSGVTISLPGNSTPPNLVTAKTFQCNGINGCVTALQNVQTNVKNYMSSLDSYKAKQVGDFNRQIDSWKQQMVTVLSAQSDALRKRMDSLRQVLTSNGVRGALNPQPIQKETLKRADYKDSQGNDQKGLYQVPENMLAVIGGDLSPALLDPNGGGFEEARGGIVDRRNEDEHKKTEVMTILADLEKSKTECVRKLREDASNKVTALATTWAQACGDSAGCSKDQISELIGSMSDLAGTDSYTDVEATLKGLPGKCQKPINEAKDKLVAACDQIGSFCAPDTNVTRVAEFCKNVNHPLDKIGGKGGQQCDTEISTAYTAGADYTKRSSDNGKPEIPPVCKTISGNISKVDTQYRTNAEGHTNSADEFKP